MIIIIKCREIIGRAVGFLYPSVLIAHIYDNYWDRVRKKDLIEKEKFNILGLVSKYLEDETKIFEPEFGWKWMEQLLSSISDDQSIDSEYKAELIQKISHSRYIILQCERYLWRTSNEYFFIPFIIAKSLCYSGFILLVELPLTIVAHCLQYAVLPMVLYAGFKLWSLLNATISFIHKKIAKKYIEDVIDIDRSPLLEINRIAIKPTIVSQTGKTVCAAKYQGKPNLVIRGMGEVCTGIKAEADDCSKGAIRNAVANKLPL